MSEKAIKKKSDPAVRVSRKIQDQLFESHSFFNPADPVQVRYEMLRRVDIEKQTVATAAKAFGFSRVAFYAIQKRFRMEGLAGLFDRQRGPKGGHKLKGSALDVLQTMGTELTDPTALAAAIHEKTGVSVHPRTVRRNLAAPKKKVSSPRRGRS